MESLICFVVSSLSSRVFLIASSAVEVDGQGERENDDQERETHKVTNEGTVVERLTS